MFEQLVLFIVAFVANAFSAFAGGGAGLLQLPALIFLGLPFATALATHKLASVALGIGASLRHFKEGSLDWRFALLMLASGVPGVLFGAGVILSVPGRAAEVALGILTMGLGIYSLRRPELGQEDLPAHRDTAGYLAGGAVLFVIGVLNGSLTSGTGLFVTL
ncbi:MAG: sulfite exporter TauE/SafE family protein, partial [Pseudomonadota bacterium]